VRTDRKKRGVSLTVYKINRRKCRNYRSERELMGYAYIAQKEKIENIYYHEAFPKHDKSMMLRKIRKRQRFTENAIMSGDMRVGKEFVSMRWLQKLEDAEQNIKNNCIAQNEIDVINLLYKLDEDEKRGLYISTFISLGLTICAIVSYVIFTSL
jgi:hypothetical protein